MKKCYMISPGHINIGNYSTINRGCLLDARGNIHIGSNVSISHDVKIVTGGHDVQSSNFSAKYLPVKIDDYVWIGTGSIILQGVHIAKGAVVCAGAVVTHDIEAYSIVAGVPAKEINKRNNNLEYHCIWDSPFT
jgi:acetyltransferase-like isoleucine patch superfamily enzyme